MSAGRGRGHAASSSPGKGMSSEDSAEATCGVDVVKERAEDIALVHQGGEVSGVTTRSAMYCAVEGVGSSRRPSTRFTACWADCV